LNIRLIEAGFAADLAKKRVDALLGNWALLRCNIGPGLILAMTKTAQKSGLAPKSQVLPMAEPASVPQFDTAPKPPARPPVDPRMLKLNYFEDLFVGQRETLMKSVMDTDVVGFAKLSGDDNPIHLCDVYAAGTRFGQRIAHGLYTASLISAVLGTRLPGPGAVYRSQSLNFHAPVSIGDVVTVTVEVAELIQVGRKVRLICEASVDGRTVLDGEAVVSVPARPVEPVV
jgi:3-hydroxybutyryl-CoA dehydratase